MHEEVISNLTLPYSYAQMRSMLSVVNESGTRMLDISFTSPSPIEAAAIANEYAKVASQYIADTMATDKPNIMSVALIPANPVSPNKTKNILLGMILGLLLGAGIVTLRMVTNDTYKTAEDIRKYTGLVTLAVVPIENENDGRKNKNGKAAKKVMNALTIRRFPPLGYACSEAVNTLCTNLSFAGESVKKIMITSCHASEGICLRL